MARCIYPPLTVAVVSHDAAVRKMVSECVSRMPGVVFTGAFDSAAPVIEQAWVGHRNGRRDPWDFLLLDWALPGDQAPACAQRLSVLLRRPRIVVLVAPGPAAEDLAALHAGAACVLPRDPPPDGLTARLETLLNACPSAGR